MKAALLVVVATAAGAQDLPAVGRITYGDTLAPGGAICTGTLVAPDLVLTAGHCVAGNLDKPGLVRFAAGYRNGQSAGVGQAAAITLARGLPDAADIALVRLSAPLPVMPVAPGPESDQFLVRIGYRRDAPEVPEREPLCYLLEVLGRSLQLMCPAVSGNSGAPLLSQDANGRWRVVAVQTGALGRIGSVAERIPPDLAALIAAAKR